MDPVVLLIKEIVRLFERELLALRNAKSLNLVRSFFLLDCSAYLCTSATSRLTDADGVLVRDSAPFVPNPSTIANHLEEGAKIDGGSRRLVNRLSCFFLA